LSVRRFSNVDTIQNLFFYIFYKSFPVIFTAFAEYFHIRSVSTLRWIASMIRIIYYFSVLSQETMYSTLFQQGLTILLLSLWSLITIGVGRLCLSATSIIFNYRGEWIFLSAGIGLVITGYAVFLLGIIGALHPDSIVLLLISLTMISIVGWVRSIRTVLFAQAVCSSWNRPAALFLGILLLVSLLLVLTPETGKDALIYHLAVPKLYLLHHGFYIISGNVFAGYPLLGEMQYLLALFLQNDILAKAMNFALLCGTLFGITLFSRILLHEHAFPAISMLIFLSIPTVFAVSHAAYNDLFVTFFTLAALYSFLRWSRHETDDWLIVCGILSGAAAACKYTALLLTPLGCLGILWFARSRKSEFLSALRLLALYASTALIAGAPFYLKNWIVLGNPFYPFFYGIFGGMQWDEEQARLYDIFIQSLGMGKNFVDYLLLPWNLSFQAKMDSPQFDGILGPIFLLTLPFLFVIRRWEMPIKILLVYALPTLLFWAFSAQQIRYLIPLFAVLAIVTGAILTQCQGRKRIFQLLLVLVAGSLAFNGYHIVRDFIKIDPLRVSIGCESPDAFLTRTLPPYPMYRFVNMNLPPDARVFLLYMKNYTFLCERDCYSDAMFEAHTLQKILREESSADTIRNRLMAMRFTHFLYDKFYLLGESSPLSEEEKTRLLAFQERHLRLVRSEGTYRLFQLF
jgi:hypothetical protein